MKQRVLDFLKSRNNGATPTEIGLALGKKYTTASSSVSDPLKRLIKEGLVKRIVQYPGVVKYYYIKK